MKKYTIINDKNKLGEEKEKLVNRLMKLAEAITPKTEPASASQIQNLQANPRTPENIAFIKTELALKGYQNASENVTVENLLRYVQWIEHAYFVSIRRIDPITRKSCLYAPYIEEYEELLSQLRTRELFSQDIYMQNLLKLRELTKSYAIC